MFNKIAIISNGELNNVKFHKKILKNMDLIICADGGANIAKRLNIEPHYIIGDLDSIEKSVKQKFKNNKKTIIIENKNQDYTDTELAINLGMIFKPIEITFLCSIGSRIDHTIANILCLEKTKNIKTKIVDFKNTIQLIENESIIIEGKKNDIVSIIPLSKCKKLNYEGLKWNVKNKNTNFGWFGVCNLMSGKKAKISVEKGKLLIIKSKD